ncbi:hypothetical protein AXG93_4311s1000 [Marchantia polymorpha subsp. ruderalis]|uniref:Uncharacterized protein n=1 Tax=Marchantia polymorpha subsp. ruderalis TaxID=1480154 RepID=A0A176W3M3_MARPO|nr:hypothetical protein AXG93_4311s1000 [Marchantia polymorpha subsp. ruderalis]
MAAWIKQLEQRLDAMATSGERASSSHVGEDFSYLASAAQVETSVGVMRVAARALEPSDVTVELDPQRDEVATLCDCGSVTATSAEICKDIVGLSSTSPAYILENVQLLDDTQIQFMANVHEDPRVQQLMESNADEHERALGFPIGTTMTSSVLEASQR